MIEHVDRVPTKPNRYAVYDEDHNFLRYEYHERADEPVQAGNPFNKALQDEFLAASGTTSGTASALTLAQPGFVLSDGATARCVLHIDTALSFTLNVGGTGGKQVLDVTGRNVGRTINKGSVITLCYSIEKNAYVLQSGILDPYEVGDYIYTKRTDVPTNWVYLNGAWHSVYTMPELSGALSFQPISPYTTSIVQNPVPSGISICGGYAFFGTVYSTSRQIYRRPISSDNRDAGFSLVYNFTGSSASASPQYAPRDFIYNSVTGDYSFLLDSYIYYSSDAFATERASITVTPAPVTIEYNNGRVWRADSTGLYYTASVRTNSWTLALAGDMRSLSVVNGRLIACVYGYVASKYSLVWSDDNGQAWTYSSASGGATLASYKLIGVDGALYAVATNGRYASAPSYAYKVTSLEGMTLEAISFPATGHNVDSLCETDLGYFVFTGIGTSNAVNFRISVQLKADNPRFTPSNAALWKPTSTGKFSDGTPVGRLVSFPLSTFCMFSKADSSYAVVVGAEYWQYALPTVTVPGAYAYLKYKEV